MQSQNRILVRGELQGLPVFSHENHSRRFYGFTLGVRRLSGVEDQVNVIAAQDVLEQVDLSGGQVLEVAGQVRSFNNRQPEGRRLIISVYAEQMAAVEGEHINQVELLGNICREPVYRQTPLGREICDVMLAVARRYRRTDYLPCILWGRSARDLAGLPVGTALHILGRLQSRSYVKLLDTGSENRIAYEISAVSAEPVFPEESLEASN